MSIKSASSPSLPTRSTIIGVGSYLPSEVITNVDLERMVETSNTWIMERTGIRERHRASSGETAATMGVKAAREALQQAGNPSIDAILVATCSPDTFIPSTASLVQRELGLNGPPAMDLNAACSGFVYGVSVADAMIRAGTSNNVLLITTEAMTRLVDYQDRSTCVLFGDGAAALVLGPSPDDILGIQRVTWGADGSEAELVYYGPSQDDKFTEDRIRMAGRGTFRLAVEHLTDTTVQICQEVGWSVEDVDLLVPHQANQRIIEATAKRLNVGLEKVMVTVDVHGNTSAASIGLALSEALAQDKIHKGSKIVCVAFGAGATWGGVALEWTS